jgi:hypothetical protein
MSKKWVLIRVLTFLILLNLGALVSCDNSTPTNVDIVTHIAVLDDQGRNLLDPLTPGFFKKEDIRIYYLRNGVREEVFHENYTWPRNFDVIQNDLVQYAMVLVPDEGSSDKEITTTLIKWNDLDEDTLKTEMIRFETTVNVTSISKIWFNDELLYDDKINGKSQWGTSGFVERLITITK